MQQGRQARTSSTSLRRARGRRRAARRPAAHGASPPARGAARSGGSDGVQLSETFDDGEALFEAAKEQRLEGVIAKRADSPYAAGRRTREWLKVKTRERQEFVIAGYTKGQGRRAEPLRLARPRRPRGRRAALGRQRRHRVHRGRDRPPARRCCARSSARHSPFRGAPKMPRVRKSDVVWVEPELVAEVEFVEWTHDGHLRAPVVPRAARGQGAGGGRAARSRCRRRLRYGQRDAEALEPRQAVLAGRGDHEGRSARVLPRGRAGARPAPARPAVHDEALPRRRDGKFFFQKDAPTHMPDWIPTRRFEVSTRDRPAEAAADRLRARERRARAALDGEHGLHRHEHVVLAGRQARPAGLGALRPRSRRPTSASPRPCRWRCS